MMTHEEMIAVIQAHKEGKEIQYNPKCGGGEWYDYHLGQEITWNFEYNNYRIKPEKEKVEKPTTYLDILNYFKNTTKEQRQKDWNEIKNLYPYENKNWSEFFCEPIPTIEDKPEPKYRPFENADEAMAAIKEHGDCIKNDRKSYFKITQIMENGIVHFGSSDFLHDTFLGIFRDYTFADGTPFGIKEE